MANALSQKDIQELKNETFIVWVFYPNGQYSPNTWENISIKKAVEHQISMASQGYVCLMYPMKYKHRMPAIPASHNDRELDTDCYEFKAAVLPLLMREPYVPFEWKEVEEFVRARGYNKVRNNYFGAIETVGEIVE